MVSYTTPARLYRIELKNGQRAIIAAESAADAVQELRSYGAKDEQLDRGYRIEVMGPNQPLGVSYDEPEEMDELWDSYLGLTKNLKPGFRLSKDEDGDDTVAAVACVWAEAFTESLPVIICSTVER